MKLAPEFANCHTQLFAFVFLGLLKEIQKEISSLNFNSSALTYFQRDIQTSRKNAMSRALTLSVTFINFNHSCRENVTDIIVANLVNYTLTHQHLPSRDYYAIYIWLAIATQQIDVTLSSRQQQTHDNVYIIWSKTYTLNYRVH